MKSYLFILLLFAFSVVEAKTIAIIEKADTKLTIKRENQLTISQFFRIQVLAKEGYEHSVYKDYYDSFRKISSLKYTIFDSQGRKVKTLRKSDAIDLLLNPSYEINDARIIILDPKYQQYPFTVEIEVEINYSSFLAFPIWMPRYAPDLEVKNAIISLECFKGFEFRAKEYNGVGNPVVQESNEYNRYTWTVENLPASVKQLSHKSFADDQAKVYLAPINFKLDGVDGSMKTWSDFGEWFLKLNEGRNQLMAETKAHLDSLKVQASSTEELVKMVYKFMQSRTRYISIQLGIGGFKLIPTDKVEKSGYGDCKALTNYMKAMLDYLGISSNYILARAGSDVPDVIKEFPSNQFNHVFLGVPISSDTLLLECTSQLAPPSYIGTFTDDRNVLWIESGKSQIIRTPEYTPLDNVKKTDCTVILNELGDAELDISVTQRGVYFDELFSYMSMVANQQELYNIGKFTHKDLTVKSFNYYKSESEREPVLHLNFNIEAKSLAQKFNGKLAMATNMLESLDQLVQLDIVNEKSEISRGFTIVDQVVVIIPENHRISFTPENRMINSEFGLININISSDGDKIYINRKLVMNKGQYQGETFSKYFDFIKKIKSFEQSKIVVSSKT